MKKKIDRKKTRNKNPIALLSKHIDPRRCTQKDAALIFGMQAQSLGMWKCPRNDDKTYDLGAVFAWRLEQQKEKGSDRTDLEADKLRLQCKKLEMDIETAKKNTMPIKEHLEFLAARAADLKDYLMGYAKMNLNEIANQPIEVCQKYWDKIIREAMNTYVKNRI